MAEGLVGAEEFAVDASLIRADDHRQRWLPGEESLPHDAGGRESPIILTFWTMLPLVVRRWFRPSRSIRPVPQRNGSQPRASGLSTSIQPTTSSISTTR